MATAPARIRRLNAQATALPASVTLTGTRRLILDAALSLFAEHGFEGASIRDVATSARVQSATLYTHYASKERILADLVEIGHQEHLQRLRRALLASEPRPRQQLTAFVRAHVRMHADFSMLAVVANTELHALSETLAGPSLTLRSQAEQLLNDIVHRGIELGVFSPPHPWLAVAAIGGMGMRVAHWFTPEFELSADQVADIYADFACRIVGAVEGPNPS